MVVYSAMPFFCAAFPQLGACRRHTIVRLVQVVLARTHGGKTLLPLLSSQDNFAIMGAAPYVFKVGGTVHRVAAWDCAAAEHFCRGIVTPLKHYRD